MIFSKLSEKSRVVIAVVLFVAVFAGLLIAASFTDLEVSDILTKDALADGEYLSHDVFGVTFEVFGSSPIYVIAGVCVVLLMLYIWRTLKLRPMREIICAVLLAGSVVAFWFFFDDMFGYIGEHAHAEDTYLETVMTVIAVICALMTSGVVTAAFLRIKDDTLKKLMKFVIAFIIMAVVANVLIMIIKDPVGRMRYRAMNSDVGQAMGGFANFQNWYESRGGQPEELSAAFESAYGVTDAFKSFPSGHTCAVGAHLRRGYDLRAHHAPRRPRHPKQGAPRSLLDLPRPVHRHSRDQPYSGGRALLLRRAHGRHHRVRVHDVRARGGHLPLQPLQVLRQKLRARSRRGCGMMRFPHVAGESA